MQNSQFNSRTAGFSSQMRSSEERRRNIRYKPSHSLCAVGKDHFFGLVDDISEHGLALTIAGADAQLSAKQMIDIYQLNGEKLVESIHCTIIREDVSDSPPFTANNPCYKLFLRFEQTARETTSPEEKADRKYLLSALIEKIELLPKQPNNHY